MDSNQCILLRTQELPRSLILRNTPLLRHIFEAGFLLISFHLSHHQRKYMKISSQRPTKRGEIELLDPGHVLPMLCELRNLEAVFWCANIDKKSSLPTLKFGHQNPNDAQKEQTFSDVWMMWTNFSGNSSIHDVNFLHYSFWPHLFFSRPSEHVARVA